MRLKILVIAFGIFTFLFLGILPSNLPAQEKKKPYALQESIAEALAENWAIKAKEEKIRESQFVKKQAWADFLPKFSTSYGYTRLGEVQRSEAIPPFIPARDLNSQDNYQWKGTITQPLFTGFALTSAHELAKLGIGLSEVDLELEKLDLVLKVKEAYFDILKADKALDVANKAVESFKSHLKVASSFYKVGMIPINDLLKAEVELANAQHDLIKTQNASRLTRSAFNTVLARPVNAPVDVEDILDHKPEVWDFENYVKRALKQRPEIELIDINLLQADQQIRMAKSKCYPEIALTYNYIKEGD